MESAIFRIHDLVEVDFYSDEKSFFDFVYGNYKIFVSGPGYTEIQKKIKVRILFHSDSNLPHSLENKIGPGLYTEENKILYSDSNYTIFLNETKNRLEIVTIVQSTPTIMSLKESLKNLIKPGRYYRNERIKTEKIYRNYVVIMRQSIHMPLFYILETMGFILLHGAAVAKNDCCYLFLGLGGIGKTTFALNLVTKDEFKFLADDYILIKEKTLYCFVEKIKLKQDMLNVLGLKKEGVKIVSKYHISLPTDNIQNKAVPNKIFFIFNSKIPRIESIDTLKAIRQVNGIHSFLSEFPEHFYPTFLQHFPLFSEMQNRYYEFFQTKEVYNLFLSKNYDEDIKVMLHQKI